MCLLVLPCLKTDEALGVKGWRGCRCSFCPSRSHTWLYMLDQRFLVFIWLLCLALLCAKWNPADTPVCCRRFYFSGFEIVYLLLSHYTIYTPSCSSDLKLQLCRFSTQSPYKYCCPSPTGVKWRQQINLMAMMKQCLVLLGQATQRNTQMHQM